MKWSILILTITDRLDFLFKLINYVSNQAILYEDVEIIYLGDNKKRTTGEKRQKLIEMAQGEYISFIDDDDRVADDYVDCIYPKLNGVDCVNFKVQYCDNLQCKDVFYNINYPSDKNLPDFFLRMPNHLMAVKRELALKAGFISAYVYEDQEYAKKLKGKLRTQHLIDKVLYYYDYDSEVSETLKHIRK